MRHGRLISAIILAGLIGSSFLPVADTTNSSGPDTATGLVVLAMGWMGPLVGQFGWFANLLLPIALFVTVKWPSRTKFAIASALVLCALAINTMFWTTIPMDNGENVIVRFRSGYWLWLASVIAGALWLLIVGLNERRSGTPDQAQPST